MDRILIEAPELACTGSVVLEIVAGTAIERGQTLRLTHAGRSCGALVSRVETGEGMVRVDPTLLVFLAAHGSCVVQVEAESFPRAEKVKLIGPQEWNNSASLNSLRELLFGRPLTVGQQITVAKFTGGTVAFDVVAVQPPQIAVVNNLSVFSFESARNINPAIITYSDIGGLDAEIRRVRELVEYPLRAPDLFSQLGIESPRGVLLYGPPGTGKTLIAKALSTEVRAECLTIQGPELLNPLVGKSEENLRAIFEKAKRKAPAIILIDEVDAIASKRDERRGGVDSGLVTMLLTLMDGLTDCRGVVVIGTTNRPNSIDPALRRPGRFEHEIHVGVPDQNGRRRILEIRTRRMPLASDISLDAIAVQTAGFVGADLASLCREAAYIALRKAIPESALLNANADAIADILITPEDFRKALVTIKPSGMRELIVQIPDDVSWDSIGGLDDVKQVLRENVIYAITKRDVYRAVGIKPAQGLLLYGPPGTGKSLLAKSIAREAGVHFLAIRGPEIKSKWYGESEERLRFVFVKAREVAPAIILLDELDAIASSRRGGEDGRLDHSILNQLLTEMDTNRDGSGVFVIGTTNHSDMIDQALLRPGRFDYQILVPEPDLAGRKAIYEIHLRGKPSLSDIDVETMATESEGFSGADIAEVCRLAVMSELRARDFNTDGICLTGKSFRDAIMQLRSTQPRLKQPGF